MTGDSHFGLASPKLLTSKHMRRTATTRIVFSTIALDLLGFGMVLPLMPMYATDPRFNASPTEIGWLMAVFSIMQFLFAPFWGQLSDRIGRRPVLIIGLFGSALSYLVYGLAQTLPTLFIARIAAGIMGANIAAAQAAMADLSPREGRARAMGLIGAAFSLGFVLGPAFGGFLAPYGLEMAPLVAAAITGINAVLAIFFLGETLTTHSNNDSKPATINSRSVHPLSLATWNNARAHPGALAICLLMGMFITLFAAFEVTLPLWGQAVLGWTMRDIGWVFAYVGMISVVIQGGIVRRLAPKLGEKRIAGMGMAFVAAGLGTYSLGGQGEALMALALIAIGTGLIHPGMSSLASLNVDDKRQGVILGLFQSMSALGRSIGPVLGGMIYGTIAAGLFPVLAVGVIIVLILFIFLKNRIRDACENGQPDS